MTFKQRRVEAYRVAVSIHEKRGWGQNRIKKELDGRGYDIPKSTISGWLYKDTKQPSAPKNPSLPSKAKELSIEKGYVLGTLTGDGCVHADPQRSSYQIILSVSDRDFAKEFARCLEKVYDMKPTIREVNPENPKELEGRIITPHRSLHRVVLSSKSAVNDILVYGEFKTYSWAVPERIKNSSEKIKGSYLSGYYDSEGSVAEHLDQGARYIRVFSTNRDGLEQIKNLLSSIGISSYFDAEDRLIIGKKEDLEKFSETVRFRIMRKQEKLEKGLNSYGRNRKFDRERYLELYEEGLNDREAAEELGMSPQRVTHWRNRLGLKPNSNQINWSKKKIVEGIQELAEKLGRKPKMDECKKLSAVARKYYFNSWNDALRAAGFEPRKRIENIRGGSKEKPDSIPEEV